VNQKIIENNIRYCLHLAKTGIGKVSPNPPVGAILTINDKIIGEGFHEQFDTPHAEVNAINAVTDELKMQIPDATLYVSLEPCMHHGKTAPCTEFILKHGIKKLVFGCYDPNPLMSGKSIQFLKEHKVNVTGPVLETDCNEMIKEFTINIKKNRPYIILKFAQSADYFISKLNERIKISDPVTDLLVHKWRAAVDGILVGSQTVKVDDPMLTTRLWPGKNPLRILLGKFSTEDKDRFRVFTESPDYLITSEIDSGVELSLSSLMSELYKRRIGILMVEGGRKTIQTFYESGLWDEARVITNQKLQLKTGIRAPMIKGILKKKQILNNDVICYISNNQAY
jgi:diaminohydroxyphosphoribosylaminopyrimidine deaminase/5-amino-6-(5-phosphoribosylamino)uracil reductase